MSEDSADDWLVEWVRTRDIPTVVARIQKIREGTRGAADSPDDQDARGGAEPDPAGAIRLLGEFARHREPEDLAGLRPEAEDAGSFVHLDAVAVLNQAALAQPAKEAATLAIKQWKIESARAERSSPLTDSIVHDVTAQRIVPEIAEFVAQCRSEGQAKLVEKVLTAFAMTSSGRTNFDKALLYIALDAAGCREEATELLRLTLEGAPAHVSAGPAGSVSQAGIVAALHHLSPAEKIAEDWIERRLAAPKQERATSELVANLLIGERDGDTELAKYAGATWEPHDLIGLCEALARRARERPSRLAVLRVPVSDWDYVARRAQERLDLVRGYAAARPDKELVEIIRLWHRSGELAGTLKELFTDIVAGGPESTRPRSGDLLGALQHLLKVRGEVPGKCRTELRIIGAAADVSSRETGAEVAELLGELGHRELRRAAQMVNEQLAESLLKSETTSAHTAAMKKFVEYVEGLQRLSRASSTLIFWALHALSDPTASDERLKGRDVAEIAVRIYQKVRENVAFDLLERYLENEQRLEPAEAIDIVARVQGCPRMQEDGRWHPLLSATVGRWADTSRRDEVVGALRRCAHYAEADAIIRSVQ